MRLILVPTLDTQWQATLRVGVSIDDGEVQVLQDHHDPGPTTTTTMDEQRNWNQAVMRNAGKWPLGPLQGVQPGAHRIKIWRLDDNVVPVTRGGWAACRRPTRPTEWLTSQGRASGCAR